jgi:hypothetical protein
MRILAFAILVGFASCGFAQDTAAQAPSAQSIQEAMKLMMPSDGHKIFDKLTGKWTSKMRV